MNRADLTARVRGKLLDGALDEIVARLDRQAGRLTAVENDLARLGPQVAGLEARLEDVRLRLESPDFADSDRAEAFSLVDEMRQEHERIRARLTAATRFEERLRQLEER